MSLSNQEINEKSREEKREDILQKLTKKEISYNAYTIKVIEIEKYHRIQTFKDQGISDDKIVEIYKKKDDLKEQHIQLYNSDYDITNSNNFLDTIITIISQPIPEIDINICIMQKSINIIKAKYLHDENVQKKINTILNNPLYLLKLAFLERHGYPKNNDICKKDFDPEYNSTIHNYNIYIEVYMTKKEVIRSLNHITDLFSSFIDNSRVTVKDEELEKYKKIIDFCNYIIKDHFNIIFGLTNAEKISKRKIYKEELKKLEEQIDQMKKERDTIGYFGSEIGEKIKIVEEEMMKKYYEINPDIKKFRKETQNKNNEYEYASNYENFNRYYRTFYTHYNNKNQKKVIDEKKEKNKYLKYKNKYLQLKNNIKFNLN